jgi:1,4-alpha-glucan branching enzyme
MPATGTLLLILHAHLPFVRHPEHPNFLEENWLFEAVAECYLPLLRRLELWAKEVPSARLTLTLTPTLCAMLDDPLLQERCARYLDGLVGLTQKELWRTRWERGLPPLAAFYHARSQATQAHYAALGRDLVSAFRRHQDEGRLEIVASAATHALLPLLQSHPASLRNQIEIGCAAYAERFGRRARGFWLPECAYVAEVEPVLCAAGIRWFVLESHGVAGATSGGRSGPVATAQGLAAFARDPLSAQQVWSRESGYPGDPVYRDFYRDIGFDL